MVELIEATGVTRTAVTEQLNELVASGFVKRTIERTGRGRPRHLYSATDSALRTLFTNNQRLIAPALLEAVAELGGEDLKRRVLQRASEHLAEHYRRYIDAQEPGERFQQLAAQLGREGVLVEVDEREGRWTLLERTCPYVDMVDDSRSVCSVEQAMMSTVVGAEVKLLGCRLDGCSGCTFEVATHGVVTPESLAQTGGD